MCLYFFFSKRNSSTLYELKNLHLKLYTHSISPIKDKNIITVELFNHILFQAFHPRSPFIQKHTYQLFAIKDNKIQLKKKYGRFDEKSKDIIKMNFAIKNVIF